ncbi:GIY-YIG nuclease family protein [uncultured Aquabacterium sp.]|uniref:GIY-YIG nuclease family protein n=1 Tax=uncultured Aquabacterium sp. TaxID=158753 RepID=UPI0025D27DA6|nr:GIY-YIG nuclease family protein [uncultured Aquabacterium sp.]
MSTPKRGYLYAIKFSTGLVKVGRAGNPEWRIRDHAKRLQCAGITVSASEFAECVGDLVAAEAALIRRCTDASGTKHLNEWFEGLDFDAVVEWMRGAAGDEAHVRHPQLNGREKVTDPDLRFHVFYADWMKQRATRLVNLALEMPGMSDAQRKALIHGVRYDDYFVLQECLGALETMVECDASPDETLGAIHTHALLVVLIQANCWSNGFPPDPHPSDEHVIAVLNWFRRHFGDPEPSHTAVLES